VLVVRHLGPEPLERVEIELNRRGFPKGAKRDSSLRPEEAGKDGAWRGSSDSGDQGCC
jgi:hypothetical protein